MIIFNIAVENWETSDLLGAITHVIHTNVLASWLEFRFKFHFYDKYEIKQRVDVRAKGPIQLRLTEPEHLTITVTDLELSLFGFYVIDGMIQFDDFNCIFFTL